MGETQNLQEQDRRNFHHLIANFSFFDLVPLRHKCPEKYKASTTNVPVCAGICSRDKNVPSYTQQDPLSASGQIFNMDEIC